jgi:hypothetical protein
MTNATFHGHRDGAPAAPALMDAADGFGGNRVGPACGSAKSDLRPLEKRPLPLREAAVLP